MIRVKSFWLSMDVKFSSSWEPMYHCTLPITVLNRGRLMIYSSCQLWPLMWSTQPCWFQAHQSLVSSNFQGGTITSWVIRIWILLSFSTGGLTIGSKLLWPMALLAYEGISHFLYYLDDFSYAPKTEGNHTLGSGLLGTGFPSSSW